MARNNGMSNSSFISKPSPHLSPQNYEPPSLDDPWLSDGLNEYYGAPTNPPWACSTLPHDLAFNANFELLSPKAQSSGVNQLILMSDGGPVSTMFGGSASKKGGHSPSPPSPSPSPSPSPTPSPSGSTLVSAAGGLQINLVWDTSVAGAPSGFKSTAIAAATEYTTTFSNPETITIDVGYGEVGGSAIASGDLAQSLFYGTYETYASVSSALLGDAGSSSYQALADSTLGSTDPTNGGKFFVSTAEAKALGQMTGTGLDGAVGLSSAYSFDYNAPTTPVASGQYDAIGALEHEISEVMGRFGSVGAEVGSGVYTPLDLFRYTSSGVRDLTVGPASPYFSINNGATNLGTYNNPASGGDASDWVRTLAGDSYGSGYSGHTAVVSATDLVEDSVLGYKFTTAGLAATQNLGLA
jgi:hypothetical protein